MNYDRVKYKSVNNDTNKDIVLEHAPKNWDNSERTIKREKTHGVVTELSKNLEFVKEGAEFLREAYIYKGGEADVILYEYRYHPQTSHPYLYSTGTFDFSKYQSNKLEVKVPFKTGGLNALIKSQEKEQFELERLESINGKTIDAIDKKTVALTSRKILLVSKLETNTNDTISKAFRMKFDAGNRTGALGIPLDITVNSDSKLGSILRDTSFTTTPNNGSSLMTYYFNNDLTKTLKHTINLYCVVKRIKIEDLDGGFLRVDLVRYNNGTDLDLVSRTTLYNVPFSQINNHVINITYNEDIVLNAGESLALQWYGGGDFGGTLPGDDGYLEVDFEQTTASIDIVEDSEREDSQTLAVYMHDIGEKLMQIITGEKGCFYSEFLGRIDLGYKEDGEFSRLALTLGFWIRQFYDKNMQISISDFLETLNTICNTGHYIGILNGKETLIVEDLKFFFQNATVIILDEEVTDYEEENASDFCHSNLEFGYKDGGDYEEAMGLDEYNIKTGFTTPLKRVETKYSKISPSRADAYAKEFARRKLKIDYPEEDTRYDKDLHLLDLKEGIGTTLEERTWEDDFEQEPKGVYSPETATNLRLTPSQIEKRHQWLYGTGVIKHQDEKIRYSNTEGNNQLITKESGLPERKERDDIEIKNLERALFEPKYVKFKHPISYEINQKLQGQTEVNGRLIPNVYFKVQYKYQGKNQTGYFMQFTQKQRNLGEFKLIKTL